MPDDIPSRSSAFDVIRLSRCNPATKDGGNGGFVIGSFWLKCIEDGLQSQGWGHRHRPETTSHTGRANDDADTYASQDIGCHSSERFSR